MPIADSTALRRGSGFEPARIYRRVRMSRANTSSVAPRGILR